MSFGKIFAHTFTGSMLGKGPTVFAVWAYAIANLKPPGTVELNPNLLGAILGAPVEDIEEALGVLTSPDPKSRTKEGHEGRRLIRKGEYLYFAPTFERYRNGTPEEKAAANAARQKRFRERKKATVPKHTKELGPVSLHPTRPFGEESAA